MSWPTSRPRCPGLPCTRASAVGRCCETGYRWHPYRLKAPMLLSLLLLAHAEIFDPPITYSGRAGQLEVRVPRIEPDVPIEIDGKLDEPAWAQAAILNGFSQ